ncbi:MAG: hypothetical protein ACRDZM_09525, partial [Acidimicrobiia bacterium]
MAIFIVLATLVAACGEEAAETTTSAAVETTTSTVAPTTSTTSAPATTTTVAEEAGHEHEG